MAIKPFPIAPSATIQIYDLIMMTQILEKDKSIDKHF